MKLQGAASWLRRKRAELQRGADRIRALGALDRASRRHPEQRVGQLIFNAASSSFPARDIFYLSDADLAERLEHY